MSLASASLIVRGPRYESRTTPRPSSPTIRATSSRDLPAARPGVMQGRPSPRCIRQTPAIGGNVVYYVLPTPRLTIPHYGVRTATHKLAHHWKKDAYEPFDLTVDPCERHNLLYAPEEANKPEIAAKFAELKAEIARLQKQYKDDGQYADSATWPAGSADGPFTDKRPIGVTTVAEAIAATASE